MPVDFGGCGEPPPVPPRRYWKNAYQTPQGHQAIQDWFAGFRNGASDAEASGWRHFATVPSSVIPGVDVQSPLGIAIANASPEALPTLNGPGGVGRSPFVVPSGPEPESILIPVPKSGPVDELLPPANELLPARPIPTFPMNERNEKQGPSPAIEWTPVPIVSGA